MRKSLAVILWLMFAVSCMAAVNVRLAWDAKPATETWTEIRCYERSAVAPYSYALVGTVPATVTTLTLNAVPIGTHTYVVRSFNGQQESLDSNAVTTVVLSVPNAPTTVTITVVIQ